jgi:hypothetical protein
MDNPQFLDCKYSSSPVDDHDLSHISFPIQASIATYNNSNNPKLMNYTNASQSSTLPTTCDVASQPACPNQRTEFGSHLPKLNFVPPYSRWLGTTSPEWFRPFRQSVQAGSTICLPTWLSSKEGEGSHDLRAMKITVAKVLWKGKRGRDRDGWKRQRENDNFFSYGRRLWRHG